VKFYKALWGDTLRTAMDLVNLSHSFPFDGDVLERVRKKKDFSIVL